MPTNADQPFAQLGYDIIGAAMFVYNDLGGGLSEEIYQESFEIELAERGFRFEAQPELLVLFKGRPLKKRLRPDLMIESEVVVELKAVSALCEEHRAQLLNYLRVTQKKVGYLINFAAFPTIEWQRLVNTRLPKV
ncbi:MAG: GxxExxY protein [Verrucomicrobia bacterium]|nr:GxxExxY protein [Verrucomicrobiota bacterium]